MRLATGIALITAIPVEFLNLRFGLIFVPAYPHGQSLPEQLFVMQAWFIHIPGMYLSYICEGKNLSRLGGGLLAATGYVETVLILFALFIACQWIWSKARNSIQPRSS